MTRATSVRAALLVLIIVALLISVLSSRTGYSSSQADVIIITPTFDRPTRFADLVHLSATLQVAAASHGARVFWIMIEDANQVDPAVERLLAQTGLRHHYVALETPRSSTEHRGLAQRNLALTVARDNDLAGPVYFADDDNAIRPELLAVLARLPQDSFTVFPVGNTGYFGFEGPVTEQTQDPGLVTVTQWCCDFCRRRWNVDMGGIAFHSSLLKSAQAVDSATSVTTPALQFSAESKPGFLESDLLQSLESRASFVLFQQLLEEVHVWHDHSVPFHREAFYDASWVTHGVLERKMQPGEEIVRGFEWAVPDLPVATML